MVDNYQLVQSYLLILKALAKLAQHIRHELTNYPVWVNDEGVLIHDREKVISAFSHFLPGGASPQQTYACPGAVAANTATFELIVQLNKLKDAFKQKVNNSLEHQEHKDTSIVRTALANAGYSGIKLKQVYRHIRCVDFHPRRISFTKTRHNSHRVINKVDRKSVV